MESCNNPTCINIREDRDRLKEQYDVLWEQYDNALSKLEYGFDTVKRWEEYSGSR